MVYGGGGDGGARNPTRKFKNSSRDQPLDPVIASSSSIPLLVSGSRTMLSFGGVGTANGSGNSFFRSFDQEDNVDDYLDEYFNQPEKKRRLSVDQIQFLERSFEAENKLEPERKIQLAKELGLQPRQIAVWFQNRRARWKSRQLETDYETLHTSYNNLKTNYDNLLEENEKLRAEILRLKRDEVTGDTEAENVQLRDPRGQSQPILKDSFADVISEEGESKASHVVFKNEEQSSEETNIEFSTSGFPRMVDSFHARSDFDESDLSQNGEDELNMELLLPTVYNFPRIEDDHCHTPPSSFYGFPLEDQAFNFWSY